MSNYTVQLKGADRMIARLKQIDSDLRGLVALQAVNAGAIQIENKARINAPVLTGALRNSVSTIAKNTANGAEAEIGFRGLAYARIQEFGGTITAKNKKYLKFRVNGKWVSTKSVRIRAKRYLGRAIDSERALVVKAMNDVVREYLDQ